MKNTIRSMMICCALFFTSCQVIEDGVAYITYDNLTVSESAANDGSFAATIAIAIIGDTFRDTLTEEDDYQISDLPTGLIASLTRVDDENLTLAVTGSIADHVRCASETVGMNIYKSAMSSGERPQNASVNMTVSLTGASYAVTGNALTEDTPNSGTVSGTATMTLGGGGTVDVSPLVNEKNYKLSQEAPDGMTFTATWTSSTVIDFGFGGTASDNASTASDVFVVSFLDTDLGADPPTVSPFSSEAFCSNTAVAIPITLTFDDCATAEISASFVESDPGGSPGVVTGTGTITLTNGTFDPTLTNGDFADDAPGGLSFDVVYASPQVVNISFSGAVTLAADHVAGTTTVNITVNSSALSADSELCDGAGAKTVDIEFRDP